MAYLRNSDFEASPLTVELTITGPRDSAGFRPFRVALFTDSTLGRAVAAHAGEIDDAEALVWDLQDLADGARDSFNFDSLDAPLLVQGRPVGHTEPELVEVLWVIDLANAAHRGWTGTGIGLLLTVERLQLRAFIDDLISETPEPSRFFSGGARDARVGRRPAPPHQANPPPR